MMHFHNHGYMLPTLLRCSFRLPCYRRFESFFCCLVGTTFIDKCCKILRFANFNLCSFRFLLLMMMELPTVVDIGKGKINVHLIYE
jgi:hypothetical protein